MPKGVFKHKKGWKHSEETKKKISLAQDKKAGRVCLNCGEKFRAKQSVVKRGWGKFCSKSCHYETMAGKPAWNKGINFVHSGSFKKGYESKLKGENHPNWKGGKSFEKYSVDWTETLRRSIRERDNYVCQICWKSQGDWVFDVHHIDENKKNCDPNNLITLCRKCHTKLHNEKKPSEA